METFSGLLASSCEGCTASSPVFAAFSTQSSGKPFVSALF